MAANGARRSDALHGSRAWRIGDTLRPAETQKTPFFGVHGKARLLPHDRTKAGGDMRSKKIGFELTRKLGWNRSDVEKSDHYRNRCPRPGRRRRRMANPLQTR